MPRRREIQVYEVNGNGCLTWREGTQRSAVGGRGGEIGDVAVQERQDGNIGDGRNG